MISNAQEPFIKAFNKGSDAVKSEMQSLQYHEVSARLKKLTKAQLDKIGIKPDGDSYLIDITAKGAAEEVVVELTQLSDEQLVTLESKIYDVKRPSKQGFAKRVEGSRDSSPKEEQDQIILKLDKFIQIEDEIKNSTKEQLDKIGIKPDGDSYLIDITAKGAAEEVVVELTQLSDEQLVTLESKIYDVKDVKRQSKQSFAERVEGSRDSSPKFER